MYHYNYYTEEICNPTFLVGTNRIIGPLIIRSAGNNLAITLKLSCRYSLTRSRDDSEKCCEQAQIVHVPSLLIDGQRRTAVD